MTRKSHLILYPQTFFKNHSNDIVNEIVKVTFITQKKYIKIEKTNYNMIRENGKKITSPYFFIYNHDIQIILQDILSV